MRCVCDPHLTACMADGGGSKIRPSQMEFCAVPATRLASRMDRVANNRTRDGRDGRTVGPGPEEREQCGALSPWLATVLWTALLLEPNGAAQSTTAEPKNGNSKRGQELLDLGARFGRDENSQID